MNDQYRTFLILIITIISITLVVGLITFAIVYTELNETDYEKCIDKCAFAIEIDTLERQCIFECQNVLNCTVSELSNDLGESLK